MPAAARLGDKAQVAADAHGCPACPHAAVGPIVVGSPNVFINKKPAGRKDDIGIHAVCCGANNYTIVKGSPTVYVNNKPLARRNDKTKHCGGTGPIIEGSPNVLIDDGASAAGTLASILAHARKIALEKSEKFKKGKAAKHHDTHKGGGKGGAGGDGAGDKGGAGGNGAHAKDARGKHGPDLSKDHKGAGTGTPQGKGAGTGTPQGKATGTGTPQGKATGTGTPQGKGAGTGTPQGKATGTGTPQGKGTGTGTPQGKGTGTGTPANEPRPIIGAAETTFQHLRDDVVDDAAKAVGYAELLGFRYPVTAYHFQVSPTLMRGSRLDEAGLKDIKAQGYNGVTNLCLEYDDSALVKSVGLHPLHLAILDNSAPTEAQMKQFLDFANDPVNQPSYVHCEAGKGRTGVAVASYRMGIQGWSFDDALADAKKFGLSLPSQIKFLQQLFNDLQAGKLTPYPFPRSGS